MGYQPRSRIVGSRLILCATLLAATFTGARGADAGMEAPVPVTPGFRPPSVPLVVVDPYLSVWSNEDHLYDDFPRHWSGSVVCLSGMIRIDEKPYRFMAKDTDLAPNTMQQVNLTVYPLRTVYTFQQDGVQLTLTFMTPSYGSFGDKRAYLVPMLPYTYLGYEVTVIDGRSHSVQLYYDNTGEGAVSDASEDVTWNRVSTPGNITMRIGTEAQNYLGQGTDLINWGYWHVSVQNDSEVSTTIAYSTTARTAFMNGKPLPPDDMDKPRPCSQNTVLAVAWDLGTVQPGSSVMKYLMVLYDQVYSIRYFGTAMVPAWRKKYNGSIDSLLNDRSNSYEVIELVSREIDGVVMANSYAAGGSNYSTINSLAWRQAVGGVETVWNNVTDELWVFMKEISSDGDVSTVDVVFPASPLFLWSGPDIVRLMLLPILDYANNQTVKYGLNVSYNLSWAPHHLGHWPICNLSPRQQEQMPVEESGNMLMMLAAAVGDITLLKPYWPLLKIWADYIVASLPNPGDQLCTDDFEGPSPQNVNLAAKGVVGLGAYSYMLRLDGQSQAADYYDSLNKGFIEYWMKNGSDGDHYKRQFNLTNSWSLKYNLLFQKVLNLTLFPDSVFETAEKYYQTKMEAYGIPLDDRHAYAKTDWEMWTAAMGTQEQFQAITNAVFKFANETSTRVPFTDWYDTATGKQQGFRARPVIGGLFARLLVERMKEKIAGNSLMDLMVYLLK